MKLSATRFALLVADGLALIPPELRRHIDNVALVIEDAPDLDLLAELGLPADDTVYGLYTGTPLTERALDGDPLLPDKIVIYREPLLADFTDPDDIRHEVARTVIHEIAHHFGIAEERLAELGWD